MLDFVRFFLDFFVVRRFFCKMYVLDEGMLVTMDLGDPTIEQERPSIWVLVDTPPILPPCELNTVIM